MNSWIEETVKASGYFGIVFLMVVENVFPPIPSELIMPLAGYVVSQGQLNFLGVVLAGAAGSVIGAIPLYYLGYWLGESRLKNWVRKHGHWAAVSEPELDRAIGWFGRHGGKTVLLCRLVPGVRSLISIPAGIAHMPLGRFLLFTTIGTAAWAALLAWIGMQLGERFDRVQTYAGPISKLVIAVLVVWYIVRVIRQYRRRHRGNNGDNRQR